MNPQVKAQWIEALRSGKYTQGKNLLKSHSPTPQFCCLGSTLRHHPRHHMAAI